MDNNLTQLFVRGSEQFLHSHARITLGTGDPELLSVSWGNKI